MTNEDILATISTTPTNDNVLIFYPMSNGELKIKNMGDYYPSAKPKITKKELNSQFKIGCSWVEGNLTTGKSGFVRTPNGKIYEISQRFKSAKISFFIDTIS